jgi:hypothetical protein
LEEPAHVARHAPQIEADMAIRAVGALDQPHEVACLRHVERVARVRDEEQRAPHPAALDAADAL